MPIITNEEKTVTEIAEKILPMCDEVFFEVGYFYFSGFEQIYKQLKDKKVNIMIGIDYDNTIRDLSRSNLAVKEHYFNYVKNDINNTNIIDNQIGQDSYSLFVEKIKNGTLKIKCNKKKINHSKIFIFKHSNKNKNTLPGKVIIGSSNFTRSGFLTNIEGNHLFEDKVNYDGYYEIFKRHWNSDDCIDIADDKSFNELNEKVLKKTWVNKQPTPYNLFIKVLDEYFHQKTTNEVFMPSKLTDGKLLDVKYQEDAIVKGLNILKKHQGVIIADVVGLGKSIIASAIAKNLNLNTIVICPPHLQDQWREYKTATLFPGEIESRGKIEKCLEYERPGENLIIIDEAQSFRNDLTNDYSLLHKLCQGNKVILLSATPFNNKPQDIFNLIKLFQIPTKSSLQNVENLSDQFKELIKEYNDLSKKGAKVPGDAKKIKEREAYIANEIRAILAPIVIRRSRIDLKNIDRYRKDLERLKITFPKVNDPKLLEYDLGDLYELYMQTIDTISPKSEEQKIYIGARYKSTSYIKAKALEEVAKRGGYEDKELLKKSLENIADFMKRLLVRRFESCIESFMKTLDAIILSNKKIKDYYDKEGLIPIYKKGFLPDVEDFIENEDDQKNIQKFEDLPELDKFKEKGLWFIKKEEIDDQFYEDLVKDIETLEELKKAWEEKINQNFKDPKFERFHNKLKEELSRNDKRKVLIFSEFADTANYIFKKLDNDNFKVFKYTSAESSKKENRNIIKKNFDASSDEKEDKFNVLVATDTIAEGYNLNRAGTIINYDIPYNPTKVIQRIGRINRINRKVYDELFIYNFFPTDTGESEVNIKKRTRIKMSMCKAIFGDDTKVLTEDENLGSFFTEELNSVLSETGNPETEYENLIYNIRDDDPELLSSIRNLPQRSRVMRNISTSYGSGILLYAKKGEESIFRFMNKSDKFKSMPVDHYLRLFKANKNEKSIKVSDHFQKTYAKASSNLFSKNQITAMDKGKKQAVDKLISVKQKIKGQDEYINDLIYIIEKLDGLPRNSLKMIRDMRLSYLDSDLKELKKLVSENYIKKIIIKASLIDQGEEKLIISEEIVSI
jgi:superfamily II DNA or RNA helicase